MEVSLAMLVACLSVCCCNAMPPHYYEDSPSYGDYYMYNGMDMYMCPMLDCMAVEAMLPCERLDRYVPRVMMNGVECETCPQCLDFTYYRSLVEANIQSAQEMYERTLVMQAFLDDNRNILYSISELPLTTTVTDTFNELLVQNMQALNEYAMHNTDPVVAILSENTEKLSLLLEGSKGDSMSDILYDFSRIRMTINVESDMDSQTPFNQTIAQLHRTINALSTQHRGLKEIIEEATPILRTLAALPEEDFTNLWARERTTARVMFKLLERTKEAMAALLKMNMDATASRLQMVLEQMKSALLSLWEGPHEDLIPADSNRADTNPGNGGQIIGNPNPIGPDEDGEEDGSGEETGELPDKGFVGIISQENNLLFSWLQSRMVKQNGYA